MNRKALLDRRAGYVEELKDVEEDIDLYSNGSFKMQTKTGDGPWIDDTPKMLDMCLRAKKTLDDIIADIDRRIEEINAGRPT